MLGAEHTTGVEVGAYVVDFLSGCFTAAKENVVDRVLPKRVPSTSMAIPETFRNGSFARRLSMNQHNLKGVLSLLLQSSKD